MSAVASSKRILSTNAYTLSPAWLERVDAIDRRPLSLPKLFAQVVRLAPKYDAVVLDGSVGWRTGYVDLLAASVIAHLPKGPAVVIADCSWKMGTSLLDRAACRLGLNVLDSSKVRYSVRSTEELELLPAVWGMDPSQVVLTPYGHTLTESEMAATPTHAGGVFAGGNALRDYETLIESVRGLEKEVTIATSLPVGVEGGLPPNVKVVPVRPHSKFIDMMRDAEVVVVPFKAGISRASGLDTYLSAMGLGNVVIVTESPGTGDYIEDGVTGIVVQPADPAAMRAAIDWAIDPANAAEVSAMRERARRVARERFSFARHAEILLDVVDDAIEKNKRRNSSAAESFHAAERGTGRNGDRRLRRDGLSVCMAIQSFRPTIGGGELQLERLVPRLVQRGVGVTVLTRAFPGQPRRERLDGVQIQRTALAGRSAPASVAFVGESLLRLLPRAAAGRTVFHAHGAMSEGTIALGATALGIPAAVTVFGTGWMGDFERLATKPGGRARRRWLMRRAWFIALSAEIRAELEQLGAPPERIFDIPNGVDRLVYHPARPDERDRLRAELGLPPGPLGLYVGRLEHIKGVDRLVRALTVVDGLALVVVGDGSERPTLEKLAADLGVAGRVHFVGFSDRVPEYLRAVDAFFLASRGEGMSNALLEAMASGLACAATEASGVRQLFGDDRGLVVGDDDPAAWSAALGRLAADQELRARLGARAAALVRERYSLDATVDSLLSAYEHMLEPRS
jgi:glycosyltransferase involved in cell wall biosynthesis